MATNTSIPHHAAILCAPGIGHMIPFLEFAKRLVTHQITPKLTFFLASIKHSSVSQAETQVLQSAKDSNLFEIIQLPPVDLTTTTLDPYAAVGYKLPYIMRQSVPLLSNAISTMATKPTILITDMFGGRALAVADKHKMKKYVLLQNGSVAALVLHTPTLVKQVEGGELDPTKPIPIPGCNPMNPTDLFPGMFDMTNEVSFEYLHIYEEIRKVDGILVKSFHELEAKTLKALKSGQISKVPVYPIGPIIRETKQNSDETKSYVVDWLDKQEEKSVVYVSLGSGYTMSYEQIKEMALGLELSGKKFVWSVKPPGSRAGSHHYLTAGEDVETSGASKFEPSRDFPDEFYRIQNMGLMVMDWAPQLEILRHSSIGGFVSHCGWNSVNESVSCGVPIVGWPLFAEQNLNAAMLSEETRIAVRVKVSLSTNMVESGEIAKAIKKIMDKEDMEGCAIRKRVKELKNIAAHAWSHDGCALSELASAFGKTTH